MAFPSFPLHLVFNILSRLPVKTVVRLQIVCKSWRSMITSADFIAAHLRESLKPGRGLLLFIPYVSPFESGPKLCTRLSEATFGKRGEIAFPLKPSSYMFQIVGSINDLVCISELEPNICERSICNNTMYVWNPSLGKLKQIGNTRMMDRLTARCGVTVYGFGYDSRSNVYKAVRVWYSRVPREHGCVYEADEVEIFTLGRNEWKSFKPKTVNSIAGGDSVAHVNGVIHWPATRSMKQHEYTCILSFDVGSEKFGEMPMPENYIDGMKLYEENRPIFIGEFKGCLSVAVQCIVGENKEQLLVWIMKDYGVASSWTKQLKLVLSDSVERTLGFTNCAEVLFQKDNGNVICYDTKASKYYRVWKSENTFFCRVWKSEESLYKMCELIPLSESLVWFDN